MSAPPRAAGWPAAALALVPLLAATLAGCPADDGCPCTADEIAALTGAPHVCVVVHNEEDDAGGVEGSVPSIPDYNGDEAVFTHFAGAMAELAATLGERGVPLSFQPDWTFAEGVERFDPSWLQRLAAADGVEIVPHAHETVVPYDALESRLRDLGVEPAPLLGGMRLDEYQTRQAWFDAHPGRHFWGAPAAGATHDDDATVPPVVLRIAEPDTMGGASDLHVHRAGSAVIATPGPAPHGVPADVDAWLAQGPDGAYLRPAYLFLATRWFKAEPDDLSVPARWRVVSDPPADVDPKTNRTTADWLALLDGFARDELEPRRASADLQLTLPGALVEHYQRCEPCLGPADGESLAEHAIAPFDFGGE